MIFPPIYFFYNYMIIVLIDKNQWPHAMKIKFEWPIHEFGAAVFASVQFSHSVMSDSLRPQGLQHARLRSPSPTPGACSNSCPSRRWCHPIISSSVIPFSSCLQSFPALEIGKLRTNESVLHIRWPKYWSFNLSISPCNEYSALISFRIDWFDLLVVQGTLKSLLQHHSSKASVPQWYSAFLIV